MQTNSLDDNIARLHTYAKQVQAKNVSDQDKEKISSLASQVLCDSLKEISNKGGLFSGNTNLKVLDYKDNKDAASTVLFNVEKIKKFLESEGGRHLFADNVDKWLSELTFRRKEAESSLLFSSNTQNKGSVNISAAEKKRLRHEIKAHIRLLQKDRASTPTFIESAVKRMLKNQGGLASLLKFRSNKLPFSYLSTEQTMLLHKALFMTENNEFQRKILYFIAICDNTTQLKSSLNYIEKLINRGDDTHDLNDEIGRKTAVNKALKIINTAIEYRQSGADPEKLLAIWYQDPVLGQKLSEIVLEHYSRSAEYFLQRYEEQPDDPCLVKIKMWASGENAALFFSLLQLSPNTDIDKQIIDYFLQAEFKDRQMLHSLLLLRAEKNEKILKIALSIIDESSKGSISSQKQKALELIEKGENSLALEVLNPEGIFKTYANMLYSTKVAKKFYQIYRDLPAVKAESLLPLVVGVIRCFVVCHGSEDKVCEFLTRLEDDFRKGFSALGTIQVISSIFTRLDMSKMTSEQLASFTNGILFPVAPFACDGSCQGRQSVTIANYILTAGGDLDIDTIENIRRSTFFIQLPQDEREHLDFVFESFKSDPAFGERLGMLSSLPEKSRAETLVKAMMGCENQTVPLTARQIRVAVLSGMLWLLKQAAIGNCYGTGFIKKLLSTPTGLKQLMEDMMTTLLHGKITKKMWVDGAIKSIEYPFWCNVDILKNKYPNDNWLARALEFTYSNMEGGTGLIIEKQKLQRQWVRNFSVSISDRLPFLLTTVTFQKQLRAQMRSYFEENCLIQFNGDDGSWHLIDKKTGDFLNDDTKLFAFYDRFLDEMEKSLVKSHENHSEAIAGAIASVKEQFRKEATKKGKTPKLGYLHSAKRTLNKIYHARVRIGSPIPFSTGKLPLIHGYKEKFGGWSKALQQNYYGQYGMMIPLPENTNMLDAVSELIAIFPESILRQAKKNPQLLSSMEFPGHDFNLRLGKVIGLADPQMRKEKYDNMVQAAEKIGKQPLGEDMKKSILDLYLQKRENPDQSLKQSIHDSAAIKEATTIEQLCHAVLNIEKLHQADINIKPLKRLFSSIVYGMPDIVSPPEIIPFADLNYDNMSLGLTCCLPDYAIEDILVDDKGKPVATNTFKHFKKMQELMFLTGLRTPHPLTLQYCPTNASFG